MNEQVKHNGVTNAVMAYLLDVPEWFLGEDEPREILLQYQWRFTTDGDYWYTTANIPLESLFNAMKSIIVIAPDLLAEQQEADSQPPLGPMLDDAHKDAQDGIPF